MPHVGAFPRALEGKSNTPEMLRRHDAAWHKANFATSLLVGIAGTSSRFIDVAELPGNTRKTCNRYLAPKLQIETAC
jgi:hypothetical protein